jgi:hypothetical protein
MSANASKIKYLFFHNKGKIINTNGLELVYNGNEPNDIHNASNIHILERIYSNHPNPYASSYKLLRIHLDENLTQPLLLHSRKQTLSRSLFSPKC